MLPCRPLAFGIYVKTFFSTEVKTFLEERLEKPRLQDVRNLKQWEVMK